MQNKRILSDKLISYHTETSKIPGTSYKEVRRRAVEMFNIINKRTKRKPYIRSAYFNKQKVFFDFFWIHITQKPIPERIRRLRYIKAGLELIHSSHNDPISMQNPNKQNEILHRFSGLTKERELFYVQIKENKQTGNKQLMSIFPSK